MNITIKPGQTFAFDANESASVYFYFTYSVPEGGETEGGERNSLANEESVALGGCDLANDIKMSEIEETKVELYLNPFSDRLCLNVKSDSAFDFVKLNSGELIKEPFFAENPFEIEVGHFQPGLYFIILENEDEVVMEKVIKK